MIKAIVSLSILTMLLSGCDPALVFSVEAARKPNASVTVYMAKDVQNRHSVSAIPRQIIMVPTQDSIPVYKQQYSCGLGGWSNEGVRSFAENIDSMIIEQQGSRTIYNTKDEITNYLLNHRKGFAKRILYIEAN